ncbi:peptidyl-alpha-hydroxyglycine alpha-amidating lyase family protein [Marinigracilibium pacificum]|uniref:Peptidylamidoglycolate lyase n=1 Tax=Marinigracilibium pacificum TaxID=2729599 RepID=A0A848IWD6_9BACT|nr:peptidyl-alpha-hydroxyglycine alpha-amidating lyase family protein [Marinigracilibium pacificum]NMM47571.1 hypothetical protein [Marinigracilibium pacificum]
MKNNLFIALILFIFSIDLSAQSPNNSARRYHYDTTWQVENKLGQPAGLGINSKGNLVVFHRAGVDPNRDPLTLISKPTIAIIDVNTGKIVSEFGSGMFILPHGLTVDEEDNIWVTDTGLDQVFKFNRKGKLLMTLGIAHEKGDDHIHFNRPTDVAVLKGGSFYVSDGYGNSRVIKFSKEGKFQFQWGEKGSNEGQFNLPHAIDVDFEGNVYVADRENGRVQKFDSNGKFLKSWDTPSGAAVYSLTVDPQSKALFTVDYQKKGNDILGSDISYLTLDLYQQWIQGRSGQYSGSICRYHDITLDDKGNIYVADLLNNLIQKFKPIE